MQDNNAIFFLEVFGILTKERKIARRLHTSTYCSSGGPGFDSQNPYGVSQPFLNSSSRLSFLGLWPHQAQIQCTSIQEGKTPIQPIHTKYIKKI